MTTEPIAHPKHELLARVFRTLGDATRLQLLEELLDLGQATQSKLLDRVDASQSRVSEHLDCPAWCGFIAAERRGRTIHYRVIDDRAAAFVELAVPSSSAIPLLLLLPPPIAVRSPARNARSRTALKPCMTAPDTARA